MVIGIYFVSPINHSPIDRDWRVIVEAAAEKLSDSGRQSMTQNCSSCRREDRHVELVNGAREFLKQICLFCLVKHTPNEL